MTGPEHYKAGETLLASAWKRSANDGDTLIQTPERRAELIASAQAHFTAALTAATAEAGGLVTAETLRDLSPWARALTGGAS